MKPNNKSWREVPKICTFGFKECNRIQEELGEEIFTTKEVSDECGVHKGTLLNWIRLGLIPECSYRNERNIRAWTYAEMKNAKEFAERRLSYEFNS